MAVFEDKILYFYTPYNENTPICQRVDHVELAKGKYGDDRLIVRPKEAYLYSILLYVFYNNRIRIAEYLLHKHKFYNNEFAIRAALLEAAINGSLDVMKLTYNTYGNVLGWNKWDDILCAACQVSKNIDTIKWIISICNKPIAIVKGLIISSMKMIKDAHLLMFEHVFKIYGPNLTRIALLNHDWSIKTLLEHGYVVEHDLYRELIYETLRDRRNLIRNTLANLNIRTYDVNISEMIIDYLYVNV